MIRLMVRCLPILMGLWALMACASPTGVSPGSTASPTVIPTPEIATLLQRAREANPPRLHAIVETSLETDLHGLQTRTLEVWSEGEERLRMLFLGSSIGYTDTLVIQNGTRSWMYNPHSNIYQDSATSATPPFSEEGRITNQIQWSVDLVTERMEFTYEGVEEVAGRAVYRLSGNPDAEGAPPDSQATLWIDVETGQVLRYDITLGLLGREQLHFREVDYDPELPAELFTFTPPEGALEQR